MTFEMPPRLNTDEGRERRVGVEIEYAGPDMNQVAELIRALYGGSVEPKAKFRWAVTGTRHGDFSVESDYDVLTKEKHDRWLEKMGLDPGQSLVGKAIENAVESAGTSVFPFEIVSPPFPLSELPEIQRLRLGMIRLNAEGTKHSLVSAFGLHLNPEVPSKAPQDILAYLRAFFLLYDWLVAESKIDMARRIAPFIRPFPQSYIDKILEPGYRPSLPGLMDDYLDENPTRNRPLDMLPLFAHLDPARVRPRAKEGDRVKAFHYRLPNCEIDDPAWTIATEWNRWVEIERLSFDGSRLQRMMADYRRDRGNWAERTRPWLMNSPGRPAA